MVSESSRASKCRYAAVIRTIYKSYQREGVEKDEKEAREWHQKAAEQGDAEAQYQVRFTMRGNPKYD